MMNRALLFVSCISLFAFSPATIKKFQLSGFAQGTTYLITYYAPDSIISKRQVDSILNRIDSSLSLYKSYSLISQFNNSDTGLKVDEHFLNVIMKSAEVFRRTDGAFDITVKPLVDAWGFGVKRNDTVPDSETISELLPCVGSELIQVSKSVILKQKSCVQIDANGIAQGYSVDVICSFLDQNCISNYLVELGGEIKVKGRRQPENESMRIGIESPSTDDQLTLIQKIIKLENGAITSSGNYRKFYESAGKKITHIIDPETGYSIQNELISVTVHAKDAITADGFDNALMVMGLRKGLEFVEKNDDISAYFIYRSKDGTVKAKASSRFERLLFE
jgi:thiamine biosynthesis lipoprotein